MKSVSLIIAASLLPLVAHSQSKCSDENKEWNSTRCATVSSGAAVSTSSGIYMIKKFSEGRRLTKENTLRIFDAGADNPMNRDSNLVAKATAQITEGDGVVVHYQLSEENNRKHHIKVMTEKAEAADASAERHWQESRTATRSVYEQVANGQDDQGNTTYTSVYKGEEPDYAARAIAKVQAETDEANARQYRAEVENARNGGKVPTYDFAEKIKEQNTQQRTQAFTHEHLYRGGKILMIERIAADKLKAVRIAYDRARGGLGGVLAGMTLIVSEIHSGYVADKLDKLVEEPNRAAPVMKGYSQQ